MKHIAADRKDPASIAAALEGTDFDVVYDMNGREQSDCEPIIGAVGDLEQYIFCSSAGVYEKVGGAQAHGKPAALSTRPN